MKNLVTFWSSTPNNLVFLASAMAIAHNGILGVACNAECPDLQQLIKFTISRKSVAISVKAETHVIILHTPRKFVAATPSSVTDRRTTITFRIDRFQSLYRSIIFIVCLCDIGSIVTISHLLKCDLKVYIDCHILKDIPYSGKI